MHLMRKRQKGMTALGLMLLLGVIGFFAVLAMRLFPVYMEYQSVASVMNGMVTEDKTLSIPELRSLIERRLDVNSVSVVKSKDFVITKKSGDVTINIDYEHRTPFVSNIDFIVHFQKEIQVTGT